MIVAGVTAHNFFSFKDLEIDLKSLDGVVQIEGLNADNCGSNSNGSGKSTLLEAILWCLFGYTIRYDKDGDAVINDKVGSDCFVTVVIEDHDETITITRYRKHSKYKNSLKIAIGDEDISCRKAVDTQEVINARLGTNYQTFLNTNLFSVDLLTSFASATDSDKKAIMERILGLEVFTKAQALAKEKVKEIKTSMSGDESKIETLADSIEENEDTLASLLEKQKEESKEKAAEIEALEEELKQTRRRIRKAEEEIEELTEKREAVRKKIKTNKDKKAEEMSELEELEKQLDKEISNLESDIRSHNKDIKKGKLEIANFEKLEGDCPTCGKPVTKDDVDAVRTEVEKRISKIEKQRDEVQAEIDAMEEEKSELVEAIAEVEEKYGSISKLEVEEEELGDEIYGKSSDVKADKKAMTLNERSLEKLNKTSSFDELIEKAEATIKDKKKQKKALEDGLSTHYENLRKVEFWVTGFSNTGIKSFIMEESLPLLSKYANEYCSKMTDGAFIIDFSAQGETKKGELREKIDVRVSNSYGSGTYRGDSSGEKRRIDLSIIHALQRVSNRSIKQTFFDEIMTTLDESGGKRFIDMLKKDTRAGVLHSAFIITNQSDLKEASDHVVKVKKSSGISKIAN